MKEKLSELVSRRIKELKLSKSKLAELTGLSRGYIGNIANETAPTESGQYNISPETVSLLSKHLEVSESEILSSMNYISDYSKEKQVQELAQSLEGFADGLEKIESPEDRAALLDDLKTIAGSMIDRELAAQERRKRAQIN